MGVLVGVGGRLHGIYVDSVWKRNKPNFKWFPEYRRPLDPILGRSMHD